MRAAFLAGVIALLSGCGSDAPTATGLRAAAVAQITGTPARAAPAYATTPERIVARLETGATATLNLAGRNGPATTWVTPAGVGLVLRSGILIGTFGFGHDLASVDEGGLAPALAANAPARTVRVHRAVDGENQIALRAFTCSLAPQGLHSVNGQSLSRIAEECIGPEQSFSNIYWLQAGRIVQSRQWVNPQVGYIEIAQNAP